MEQYREGSAVTYFSFHRRTRLELNFQVETCFIWVVTEAECVRVCMMSSGRYLLGLRGLSSGMIVVKLPYESGCTSVYGPSGYHG